MDREKASAAVRARDLKPLTVRLTPDAKRRLMALAQIKGGPAYQLMEEAFWSLWDGLPSSQKDAAEELVRLVDRARGEGQ
jgi:acyl-CoA-binding protein